MAWYPGAERDSTDVEDEASVGLMEPKLAVAKRHQLEQRRPWLSRSLLGVLLVLSNMAWAGICWFLMRELYVARHDAGYEADFVAKDPLPHNVHTIAFDDLLIWNETSHTIYRQMDSSLPLYFGRPFPAIDAAWDQLLQYEYPVITSEEMALNPSLTYNLEKDKHPVTGKHHFALDVFHNLHCLNAVRKELDKDYYGGHHDHGHIGRRTSMDLPATSHSNQQQSAVEAAQRDHIDHCMNHIRQSLQCRADLSPAAMHVFEDPADGSSYFVGNAERHTCVDWEAVVRWAERRRGEPGYTTPLR